MRLNRNLVVLSCMLLLAATGMFAQGTTGALGGTVTQSGAPLPGVTVTISSPRLQGTRTSVTNENGAYSFPSIPPGEYNAIFSLSGLQDVTKKVGVSLVETARLDADMKLSAVTEAITVTANATQVMETTTVETNFKQATVNRLPIARTPTAQSSLAPGVTPGINGNTISGAMSYDNLYLVNGAVVNENLRGQSHELFIEDALQETTVLSAGVSAEYGRFTGGVISSITKSGGNDFSGSLRDSVDNPKWTSKSQDSQPTPINKRNNTYEATLGGRIVRDRLWFFTAGRKADTTLQRSFLSVAKGVDAGGFVQVQKRSRFEGKLTGNITNKHSLVASYLNNNFEGTNDCQFGCLDTRTLAQPRKLPNNFKTLHYNGVITNNLLLEGNYAKKFFAFVNSGGSQPRGATSAADLASGSPILDNVATGGIFNAPYFCGSCGSEQRNNKEWDVKGRYFLGTKSLGTHNVSLGYDNWAEQRVSNNYQSPTDFRFDILNNAPVQNPDGTVSITIKGSPTTGDRFVYFPIAFASLGSNLKTSSVFVNDKWDLNQNFSFNVGARYDKNDAKDSSGVPVSKDKAISPRLGVIYDVMGNGRLRLDATYGHYVGRLAETVAGLGSAAGAPAVIIFRYSGPDIPLQDSRLALTQAFQWLLDNGGINRAPTGNPSIPGFNRRLAGDLSSPFQREFTVGAGTQIGKGTFRADIIDRRWSDFYVQRTSLGIGTVTNPANSALKSDLILVSNSNDGVERKYRAFQVQGQYQLFTGFGVGGNYTNSRLKGNLEGESSGGGPGTFGSQDFQYSQYQNFTQNAPVGYLAADQRHKARLWGAFDFGTPIGHFNLGAIERFDSGQSYSVAGSIPIRFSNTFYGSDATKCPNGSCAGGIVNPGYAAPPTTVTYFFENRGSRRWADIIATDLALNYELPVRYAAIFAKGEVRNVFNRKAIIGGNTNVNTAANNGKGLIAFNPFTDTPKECPQGNTAAQCSAMGANYQLDPLFGTPTTNTTFAQAGHFQLPRTFLVSAGVRF